MKHLFLSLAVILLFLLSSWKVRAQAEEAPDSSKVYEMPRIEILEKKGGLFENVPGSATHIGTAEMNRLQPLSGNEVFRRVPGLNVVDEEGLGLRVNLGIRGLDPDRSRSVLVLEDGVPVALNPYGEPEMYYTPAIDRMAGVEVLKGSGQILFGPQTIGGVVNYLTADPPEQSQGLLRLRGGQGGYFSGLLSYGNTYGNTGMQLTYLRKQGDNIGPTWFRLNDLNAKFKFQLGARSFLGLKLGFYDERSNSTYVGLTTPMFEAGGKDFVRLAPDDRLDVSRYSASLTHEYRLKPGITLRTTAFAYTTTRNWQRQDFSSSANASNQTGVVWGDPSVEGGAIYMRDQNGHRNRRFEVAGIEPRLTAAWRLGGMTNTLETGLRYIFERAYEQRINGRKADAGSGTMVNDEIRTGNALSAYAQNKFYLSSRFTATAGLRMEWYDYTRDILRLQQVDTQIVAGNTVAQLIPGIGLNYHLDEAFSVFGGLHRGFAPPRVKDAIANTGEVYDLDAELSWNAELGGRFQWRERLMAEVTAFYMDFSNQIIPVSESSGGSGAGLVNGGETVHAGVEAALRLDVGKMLLPSGYLLQVDAALTLIRALYSGDRFVQQEGELVNIRDNRTPYSPQVLGTGALTFEAPFGLGLRATVTYVGQQFTDELNTIEASADGRVGELPAYFLLDAGAHYQFAHIPIRLMLSVKNLTDERYIATRRPQGIRVGLPRFVTAGVEWNF